MDKLHPVRSRVRLGALALLLTLLLVACASGGGTEAGSEAESEAAEETSEAAGGESEEEGGGGEGEGLIAVLLPDTESSDRWENFDRRFFTEYFENEGLVEGEDFTIQNAEGDPATQQTQADQALTQGATVVLLTNLDSGSGAAIHDTVAQAGASIIDYDRLTLGGQADFYVSFDNVRVGELQGETLVECVEAAGTENPRFAVLNGSPDDNNATLFAEGYNSVLEPLESEGWTRVDDQDVPDWENSVAQTIFEQMLTNTNNGIDAVVAANDGLANAAIAGLRAQNLQVPVTGQDATAQGLQNIALGDQCMTVYKPINLEVEAAVEAALALRAGEELPETEDTVDNENGEVPSALLEPIAITIDNLMEPIDDGFVDIGDVCTGEVADTEFCQENAR